MTHPAVTDVPAELALAIDVPVLSGPQPQGDVMVIPAGGRVADAMTPLPRAGVPVVRGEAGGNTHALLGTPGVRWDRGRDGAQTLGTLTVPDDATAWLEHPEHGQAGIAPGSYVLRRQREQADEIRYVAD